AVSVSEGNILMVGKHRYFIDASGAAPAALCHREVVGNSDDGYVVTEYRCFFVETAGLCIANACIDRRDHADQFDLAGEIGQGCGFDKTLAYSEIRGLVTDLQFRSD